MIIEHLSYVCAINCRNLIIDMLIMNIATCTVNKSHSELFEYSFFFNFSSIFEI